PPTSSHSRPQVWPDAIAATAPVAIAAPISCRHDPRISTSPVQRGRGGGAARRPEQGCPKLHIATRASPRQMICPAFRPNISPGLRVPFLGVTLGPMAAPTVAAADAAVRPFHEAAAAELRQLTAALAGVFAASPKPIRSATDVQ